MTAKRNSFRLHPIVYSCKFWFAAVFMLQGCAHPIFYSRPFEPREESDSTIVAYSPDEASFLRVYRNVLRPILFSECKNSPSDSAYALLAEARSCPVILTYLTAIGRLLREHDLYQVSPHMPFVHRGHIVWPDNQMPCVN